ncbi:MAG TPA: 5'-nucleotidase C-terminal domain-containing protein, partial [Thermoanaerobaculia bacterium]|nr:5'-nucleotidase C-terminal domain-containing protein [Thermoanaerobaculia bacterium]
MRRLILIFLLAASGCATAPPPVEPVRVVLVGTTDVHGWFNGRVENGVQRGGVAILASYVEALRAASGDNVVLVDSGDMFQGTLESNLFEGEPVVRAYNALGYAAAAVGNHEFDYGPVGPRVTVTSPQEDELGALKQVSAIAEFPLLAANMVERDTGRTPSWAKRYTMVDVDSAKIGIIGLATPDTPNVTLEQNVRSLVFTDPLPATIDAARELRAMGADAIVVIAHMGGRCKALDNPNDPSSCEENHEANALLRALPPDTVDVYFAGHTHSQMRHFINGVATAQSAAYSNEFSTIEIWVDPRASRVLDERTVIRPPTPLTLRPETFEGRAIERDARLQQVIEPFLAQVAVKRNEPLGITTTAAFERSNWSEAALGNLFADALREWSGADVGIMNSGGIRSDLRAGDLIYADVFEVSPFDNYPTVVTMTGQQLIDAIEVTSGGGRAIMQVSGIRYTIDRSLPSGERVTSVTLANGDPIDPAKLYKVVMPDFLAFGGDGMAPVTKTIPAERMVT